MLKQTIQRYFAGVRELPVLWKAGTLCSLVGLVGILFLLFRMPTTLYNTPAAVAQGSLFIGLFLVGVLIRFAGAIQHTRRAISRRRKSAQR